MSEGEFISLSKYEVEDIKIAVKYLKTLKYITKIGIWGRSMGAVTALFYALEDSNIQALVLDSPFSSLKQVAIDIASEKSSIIPNFMLEYLVSFIRQ